MDLAEGSKGEGEECSGSKDDGKGTSGLMSPPANVGGILRCEEKTAREGSVEAGNHVPCPTRKGEKKVSTSSGAVELASPALVSRSSSSLPKSHISSSSSKPQAYRYSASSEEESEAEYDEKDFRSYSSRSSQTSRFYTRKITPQTYSKLLLHSESSCSSEKITNRSSSKRSTAISKEKRAPVAPEASTAVSTTTSESHETMAEAASSSSAADAVDRPPHQPLSATSPPIAPPSITKRSRRRRRHHHLPPALPTFREPRTSMWTSTHDANAPSEDRFSSLVNVLLRPPKSNIRPLKSNNPENDNASTSGSSCSSSSEDEGTTATDNDDAEDNTSLVRLSLWAVIDGHGGGCVATYASEVLLPHIAASVARALKCTIADRGVCTVNGQLRDANALDLDGLIRNSDRSRADGRRREAGIDVVNPNSIHYRSPGDDSESEGEAGTDKSTAVDGGGEHDSTPTMEPEPPVSVASSLLPRNPPPESASSVKTSVKTAISPATQHAPVGTHSTAEIADITKAITDSFLAVDEGWINSIDPITTHQTSCISNGRWNAGACALVVFTVQRLDWTRSSMADPEIECEERGAGGGEDTSHNKDAARRRKLDYATKSKSVSSLSTLSSTSSLATEAPPTAVSVQESEITETEDDDDVSDIFGPRRCNRNRGARDDLHHQAEVVISAPGGCKCHCYRPHDAMLYTAHVGDCRAVMLGSAPPRTIKVRPEGDPMDHADTSEDDSSCDNTSDESEGISSSDHESDSSDGDDDDDDVVRSGVGSYMSYMRRPAKRQCRRGASADAMTSPPYVPLPPLNQSESSSSEESETESDDSSSTTAMMQLPQTLPKRGRRDFPSPQNEPERPPSPTQLMTDSPSHPPPMPLSPLMRPIDLTTDHSAYNPAEVTAVLRRCNNAPRAISAASGGGIKRVAGSLAVTRALGDAYLKTPRLSFFPYKRHAPYITARPEVNCRLLTKGGDRVLILASDGVWERASGDDVLRWVRNYYNERIAGVERHHYSPHHKRRTQRSRRRGHHRHHHRRRHSKNRDDGDHNLENRVLALPPSTSSTENPTGGVAAGLSSDDGNLSGHKRKRGSATSVETHGSNSSHGRRHRSSIIPPPATVSDVIVRRVLNKVRRARNISSLRILMSLPKGRPRRSKHDDITASVVDMSGFVS
uniref:PPM-type phosphatase domain-containing protein n=1 Tax=Ditylum brightwellii TaxID=49249 RepID=A0A7S1ZH97_9STRA|mmetsp:Transcript_3153/g.4798  ORF Transcript_3153/g.4798 Transcript_3153/m.4798 type:complete len:1160 (+) Transcript_3153:138-3617(+)